ncbi:RNA-dependent ATPase HCA4 [Aspergillus clavatus NRRL 1]|uniref:ATP-dependent RNA helicase dbp4 n=1 Tax=Aspergillus clavatus (strain ATCC 1007 / CBS 513.65 / DSM 816 / NCTC 3887 / NRRL 1 / QM 1276 / 107) TaxID=344612 RepID=DBP4_ASPCL|nr:DEAD box RNA helicase (Hca4), putative [Aspergillus clavatus NRRL 1]A1CTZ2.1 RecName: Full=ATP-dependent RNA helicase dbp4 [Aspergillus clavatus NRRL 1]EAW06779.1 DEAD box RNA helicase (Hca4), putative [Aspergillus clavatus NRRL 1]
MAPTTGPRNTKNAKPAVQRSKTLKRKRGQEELSSLIQRVEGLDLKESFESFSDLPLSEPTLSGLTSSHFKTLTDIQSRAISHALKGRDVLGAAKTGSGKTLAFLVPVLENLYRRQWAEHDGLGALILSPTRELAIQIFEVLRKIGRYHTFSAGLVIGGKSLREEQERLGRMNILVCTPGRMLQHLDQTALFDTYNLQMLVLDEADRILDLGFQQTVDAIVGHLPKERQTLLFSATQTKKVSDLARLSLRDPEYVAVHETASTATPAKLQQHYVIAPLPQKLDILWSFIRSNLKSKTMVFFSSGKQVRFVYESFRHMQPGIPLMHLHGRQKQGGRLDIMTNFSQAKHCVLFSTDVAARGLDFPAVDWVIQMDCPEDADTYIHRVGRTARYGRDGRAVLFLDPSEEEGMLKRLEQKKVPIEKINIKANKQQSIKDQLQNMCFKDPELKYIGQKAFISYVKSVYIQKDKEIFKLKELKLDEFASSLGLPGAPRIKFIKGDDTKQRKNAPRAAAHLSSDDEAGSDAEEGEPKTKKKEEPQVRTKYDRMFERRNQDVLAEHYSKLINDDGTMVAPPNAGAGADADEDDDFLSVKRRFDVGDETLGMSSDDSDEEDDDDDETSPKKETKVVHIDGKEALVIDSKRREKLLKSKKKLLKFKGKGTKLVYDDEGNAHEVYELEDEDQFKARGDAKEQKAKFLEEEAERTRLADLEDKEIAKQKRREKKEKRKARERELLAEAEDEEETVVQLPPYEGDHDMDGGFSASEEEEEAARPSKKPKVKFAEPDESDKGSEPWYKKSKRTDDKGGSQAPQIQTLEDLESLASGLLG